MGCSGCASCWPLLCRTHPLASEVGGFYQPSWGLQLSKPNSVSQRCCLFWVWEATKAQEEPASTS